MGANCVVCKKDMSTAEGCVVQPIWEMGVTKPQVLYGEETHYAIELQLGSKEKKEAFLKSLPPSPKRCPDCGTTQRHPHHPGCDQEECPFCHLQMIGCGHGTTEVH